MDAYDICGWTKSIVFTAALGLRGEVCTHPGTGEVRATFSRGLVTQASLHRVARDSRWHVMIPGELARDPWFGTSYRTMKAALVALDRRYAKVRNRNLRATMEALDYDSRSSIIENVPGLVGIVAKATERRMEKAAKMRKAMLRMESEHAMARRTGLLICRDAVA